MQKEAVYTDHKVTLAEGDGLFLYTEGLIKNPDEGGVLLDVGQLKEKLRTHGGTAPSRLIRQLVRDLGRDRTGASHDLTLISLRRESVV